MSFSGDTKSALAQERIDKNCCLTACLAGMLHFSPVTEENVLTFKTDSIEVSDMFCRALATVAGVQVEAKKVGTSYKTELVFGKITKKFANSINVSVNDGQANNYSLNGVTVYNYENERVSIVTAADLQRYDSENPSKVFIRLYDGVVKEIIIIK